MRINAMKLATATSSFVGIVWLLCSVAVAVAPDALRYISGAMVHLDLSQWAWDMGLDTFFVGLLAWTVLSWVTVWGIVTVYQRLLGGSTYE
tara:strand:- start:6801 stop:7073 length:273 start_codon:yes stop_codon:yes gene_type:complete